jgi:hypothetical protein
MSKARKGTVHVVERVAYRAWDYDVLHYAPCYAHEGDSFVPVAAFADEAKAEACRDALEADAKASLPPALFCDEIKIPDKLSARLKKLGLTPPKFSKQSYDQGKQFRRWWAEHAAEITPEKQAAIWELFSDIVLYRVRAMELQD